MPYRVNNKFVSKATWEAHQAAQAASEENTVSETAVEETTEKRTRQADPLLAAKRRLEAARKRHAKAEKKVQAIEDVTAEWEAAQSELVEATEAFQDAVAAV